MALIIFIGMKVKVCFCHELNPSKSQTAAPVELKMKNEVLEVFSLHH